MLRLVKAHAYGNDFLYVDEQAVAGKDRAALARHLCERRIGIGADGLVVFAPTAAGARMALLNADGSYSEVSGNGVRGLAAVVARERGLEPSPEVPPDLVVDTDAGPKVLTLLEREGARFRFRADMGQPEAVRRVDLDVAGERVEAVTLRVGNPQCVVLGPLDPARLARLGPALQRHRAFPDGVNVELAAVEAPDRVRILIWERGVGPTRSSGTGSCASAVAAAVFGGAARAADVIAPGGTQRVEWLDAGLVLTGWAEVVLEGWWTA